LKILVKDIKKKLHWIAIKIERPGVVLLYHTALQTGDSRAKSNKSKQKKAGKTKTTQ
jgi:hypothetical protein